MTRLFKLSFLLLAVSASPAFAVVLEDFETGYAGPGTLITDPADVTNTALHLVSHRDEFGVLADIFTVDTDGFVGKVTMDIYDFGATVSDFGAGTDNGPRWGIQGDADLDGTLDNWAAAGILQRPGFLDANQGYTYINDDFFDPDPLLDPNPQRAFSFNGDWFTVNFYGNPRRVLTANPGVDQPAPTNGLQLIGSGTFDNPDVPSTGGAWTTWEFDVAASGEVTITAKNGIDTGVADPKFLDAPYDEDVQTQYTPQGLPAENMVVTNMKQIWVTGGQSDLDGIGFLGSKFGVHGILVDNVTFDGVTTSVIGDFDGDGDVDGDDFGVFVGEFGNVNGGPPFDIADFDEDGDVDGDDFGVFVGQFGTGTSTTIPEPSSLALLALVAVGFAGRRGTKVA